jgi:hypothetical protein
LIPFWISPTIISTFYKFITTFAILLTLTLLNL